MKVEFDPIGVIRTPFTKLEGMPIQPTGAVGVRGTVEVFSDFAEGLKDLDGFSHIVLIYHFHRASAPKLTVTPFLDSKKRGVFATRAPSRPNPIGFSVVRLVRVEGTILHVENVDILDGTPLLDVKPHVPDLDAPPAERVGWLKRARRGASKKRADDRFV